MDGDTGRHKNRKKKRSKPHGVQKIRWWRGLSQLKHIHPGGKNIKKVIMNILQVILGSTGQ